MSIEEPFRQASSLGLSMLDSLMFGYLFLSPSRPPSTTMYEGKIAISSATTIMPDDIVVVRSVAETTGRILLVMENIFHREMSRDRYILLYSQRTPIRCVRPPKCLLAKKVDKVSPL